MPSAYEQIFEREKFLFGRIYLVDNFIRFLREMIHRVAIRKEDLVFVNTVIDRLETTVTADMSRERLNSFFQEKTDSFATMQALTGYLDCQDCIDWDKYKKTRHYNLLIAKLCVFGGELVAKHYQDPVSTKMIVNRLSETLTNCDRLIAFLVNNNQIIMNDLDLSHNQAYIAKVIKSLLDCIDVEKPQLSPPI